MPINELGQFALNDLSGKQVGDCVVLPEHKKSTSGGTLWKVRCKCGNEWFAWAEVIHRHKNLCCKGCRKKVQAKARTTHGGRYTPEYAIWVGMWQRCTNLNHKNYAWYGGRGITVCDRWNDFRNFIADMGPRPDGLTIERIGNNGNYEPGNCKWGTDEEQNNNRRTNKYIVFENQRLTYSQWSRVFGMNKTTIRVWFMAGKTPEQIFGGRQRII